MEEKLKNAEFTEKISKLQTSLKAPKGQRNDFGNYQYRSAEDILEAVKPLLKGLLLTITDDIVLIGERYYVKATVKITDGVNSIENVAYARESLTKRGMDESQITGATSSYARKYSLNGLLCIDDTKDADSPQHPHNSPQQPTGASKPSQATPNTDEAEMRVDISEMLKEMCNGDIEAVKDSLEKISGFEGSKGYVKGKRSTFELKGKWLANVQKKVREEWDKWGKQSEKFDNVEVDLGMSPDNESI